MSEASALLRLCNHIDLNAEQAEQLKAELDQTDDFNALFSSCEYHKLSSLLYRHVRAHNITLPRPAEMALKALVIRHKRAHSIRHQELMLVLNALSAEPSKVVLLKGAALIHTLYPSPELRPMSDVDLLVPPEQAAHIQLTIMALGYRGETHKSGYLFDHHHLPGLVKKAQGMTCMIEVHHDALSGDVAHSITLNNLIDDLQPLALDNAEAFDNAEALDNSAVYALGPIDQLRHLAFHTFEPCKYIRLGALLDFVGYAERYADEIDWQYMQKVAPHAVNALRCSAYIRPFNAELSAKLKPSAAVAPQGLGLGFEPLSEQIKRLSGFALLRNLLNPSDWWLHVFYQVPPEASLKAVKLWRHPVQIMAWLGRRYWAAMKSRWRLVRS